MKRAMRWHDFGSGREADRSQYREYWQGKRQCHGPKLVPARRVAAKTGGTPQRGAGAPLAGMRPRRCAPVLRIIGRACVLLRGRIQARSAWNLLRPAQDTLSAGLTMRPGLGLAQRGAGRGAKRRVDAMVPRGLCGLLPQTGLRQTSRSRRDMLCAVLRVSTNFGSNAHVFH